MIRVIALTQFAFVALGVVALQIMLKATGSLMTSPNIQFLTRNSLWLFAVPVLWIGLATLCSEVNRPPLSPRVAQITGVLLVVLCFLFMMTTTFLVAA